MYICDEKSFENIVARTRGLCAWGMGSESLCRFDSVFYRANRLLLLNSYREFVICCTWLRENCTSVKNVSEKSPNSRLLQQMAKTPHYVGHGAMIAAILYMGFPYKADPYSTCIKAGISLSSPCFRSSSADSSLSSHHPAKKEGGPYAPAAALPVHRVKRSAEYPPGLSRNSRLPVSAPM